MKNFLTLFLVVCCFQISKADDYSFPLGGFFLFLDNIMTFLSCMPLLSVIVYMVLSSKIYNYMRIPLIAVNGILIVIFSILAIMNFFEHYTYSLLLAVVFISLNIPYFKKFNTQI